MQGDSCGEACPKADTAALGRNILRICRSADPNQGSSSLLMLDRQDKKKYKHFGLRFGCLHVERCDTPEQF